MWRRHISTQYSGAIRSLEASSYIETPCRGLGYGLVPMVGGIFELVARTGIIMLVAGHTSFAGVCLADPAAWISALIPLIPYYIYKMRKWGKQSKVKMTAN